MREVHYMNFQTGKELGSFIKNKRNSIGFSQLSFAGLLQKHQSYISKLEAGVILPPRDVSFKIAKVLEISSLDFYKGIVGLKNPAESVFVDLHDEHINIKGEILAPLEQLALINYRQLTPEGKKYLDKTMRLLLKGEGRTFLKTNSSNIKASQRAPLLKKSKTMGPGGTSFIQMNSDIDVVQRGVKLSKSKNKAFLFREGKRLYRKSKIQEAFDVFDKYLSKERYKELEVESVARFLMMRNENETARNYFSKVKTIERAETYYLYGLSLIALGEMREAEKIFKKGISSLGRRKHLVQVGLAHLYKSEKKLIELKEITSVIHPKQAEKHMEAVMAGISCSVAEEYTKAIEYFNQHNKVIPHNTLEGATPEEVFRQVWSEKNKEELKKLVKKRAKDRRVENKLSAPPSFLTA